jgi:hypothetical protein
MKVTCRYTQGRSDKDLLFMTSRRLSSSQIYSSTSERIVGVSPPKIELHAVARHCLRQLCLSWTERENERRQFPLTQINPTLGTFVSRNYIHGEQLNFAPGKKSSEVFASTLHYTTLHYTGSSYVNASTINRLTWFTDVFMIQHHPT